MSAMSGERLAAARAALDISQLTLSTHSGINQAIISQWENGLKSPSEHSAGRVQKTLAKLRMIQQRHAGVKVDMNDIRFVRNELRKLDGAKKIP